MEIRVTEQLEDGSWDKQKFIVADYTKSDAGDRWVYLSSKAKKIIQSITANNKVLGYKDE